MNLSILIIVPLLTALCILPLKELKQVRAVSLTGSIVQLLLCLVLLYSYLNERTAGNVSNFLFESNYTWYGPLNINYHVGVDGISLAMILLTAFVVIAGTSVEQ